MSYATIYVQLSDDLPNTAAWNGMLDQIEEWVSQHLNGTLATQQDLSTLFHDRLALFHQRVARQRSRRGLANFVGKLSSWLFGTATEDDIKKLKEADRLLATTVEGVVKTQNVLVGRVNELGRVQRKIITTTNAIIANQAEQREVINLLTQTTNHNTRHINLLHKLIRVINTMDTLTAALQQYEVALAAVRNTRLACEASVINEDLVPPAIINQLLDNNPGRSLVTPIQYYEYGQVKKTTTIEGADFCIVSFPLFSSYAEQEYRIATFPVCANGSCIQIKDPLPFVLNSVSADLYFPDECIGRTTRACRPGVRFDKNHQACLHGLVNRNQDQQQTCPIRISQQLVDTTPVATAHVNKYILTTPEVSYQYRCPDTRPQSARLTAGTYVITLEPRCVMDAHLWLLHGLPLPTIFSVNVTTPTPQSITLDWMTQDEVFKQIPQIISPQVPSLDLPTFHDLQFVSSPDLEAKLEAIHPSQLAWWIWMLISLAVFGAIATMIFITYKVRECRWCPRYSISRKPAPSPRPCPYQHDNPAPELEVLEVRDSADQAELPDMSEA